MYCQLDDIRRELEAQAEEIPPDELLVLAGERASDIIEAFTGRHFRAEPHVEVARPLEGWVLLEHWPVVELLAVRDLEGTPVDALLVNPKIGDMWVNSSEPVSVEYLYNDPDNPVPEDIRRVCAWLAARLLAGPPGHVAKLRAGELALEMVDWPSLPREVRLVLLRHSHRRRIL